MKAKEKVKELFCANCSWRCVCEVENETCPNYDKAMQMHEWDKQQVAEKCKHFLEYNCFGGYYNRLGILDVTKLFDDLIKFIKQEE